MPRFAELRFYLPVTAGLFAGIALCALQISSDLKADEVAWQPLARITIEKLPAAPMYVALTRVTYDSRAAQPSQSRPGSVLEYVESGRMELEATGDLTVLRGPPGTTSQRETIDQGTSITLSPGDSIFIAGGTSASARNPGEEPANVLMAEISSTDDNGQAPGNPVPVKGVAIQPLASAVATAVSTYPALIELGRLTLAVGAKLSSESAPGVAGALAGPELAAVESGTFGLKVSNGQVELFPEGKSTLGTDRKGRGQIARLLTEITLRPGDAMMGQAGTSDVVWNTGKIPAAAILVRFLPAKAQQ
jgi:mannose-6-phosphate isomerase-like protein (cupin superfamily)